MRPLTIEKLLLKIWFLLTIWKSLSTPLSGQEPPQSLSLRCVKQQSLSSKIIVKLRWLSCQSWTLIMLTMQFINPRWRILTIKKKRKKPLCQRSTRLSPDLEVIKTMVHPLLLTFPSLTAWCLLRSTQLVMVCPKIYKVCRRTTIPVNQFHIKFQMMVNLATSSILSVTRRRTWSVKFWFGICKETWLSCLAPTTLGMCQPTKSGSPMTPQLSIFVTWRSRSCWLLAQWTKPSGSGIQCNTHSSWLIPQITPTHRWNPATTNPYSLSRPKPTWPSKRSNASIAATTRIASRWGPCAFRMWFWTRSNLILNLKLNGSSASKIQFKTLLIKNSSRRIELALCVATASRE